MFICQDSYKPDVLLSCIVSDVLVTASCVKVCQYGLGVPQMYTNNYFHLSHLLDLLVYLIQWDY